MPPQKTQIACPRCHKPIIAQIEQLFDVSSDPGSKQRFLGSISNFAVCQSCGYSGPLATPIVYHDASKELLLTYFPGELGVPLNEQEKLIGPLITQVSNRLPLEKRKAYLLRPQSFLTYQSLIERILGADGITPDMIKAQQARVAVIEHLLGASSNEARSEIIKQQTDLFDAEFFAIFNRLLEGAHASGQEQATKQMDELQTQLLTETEFGRKAASQTIEIQEAVKTLQAAGKSLDRDKLLDILVDAPNDDRLNALVSLTRPGLDYVFFQSLTERMDKKSGEERKRLEVLRGKLLDLTRKIDQLAEEEMKQADALLKEILAAEDVQKSATEHLDDYSESFIQLLNHSIQEANKKNDAELMPKLQLIVSVIQQASTPPPELALLEELLAAPDENKLNELIKQHSSQITQEFCSLIANVITRSEEKPEKDSSEQERELLVKLHNVYRAALKVSMSKNLA